MYQIKTADGVALFGDNAKGKSGFAKRLAFGKVLEKELKDELEQLLRKLRKSKDRVIYTSEEYQTKRMGIPACNTLDTILGDILIANTSNDTFCVEARFDGKRAKKGDIATISLHGRETGTFNSYPDTFYVTGKKGDFMCVWGQDLIGKMPSGMDLSTGDQFWTVDDIKDYLIPLEEVLKVELNKDYSKEQKCDHIDALRKKYNPISPQSVAMIVNKQQQSISTFSKATSIPINNQNTVAKPATGRTLKFKSVTPGYYATISTSIMVTAEKKPENTTFILTYCPKPGESQKDDVKVEFNDIRTIWKSLVKGNNNFIKSKDLENYMKPVK